MFTGIVEEVGRVKRWEAPVLEVSARKVLEDLKVGDSIAVNGACLTVVSLGADGFTVELSPETLRRTSLGQVAPGKGVNLERAVAASGRLGGHIVQGHVDGTATVASIQPEGQARLVSFRVPPRLARYIVEKGFVAVDGISLTVVSRDTSSFSVSVIPYTWDNTTMCERVVGDAVNIEVDILAKYVESLVKPQDGARSRRPRKEA